MADKESIAVIADRVDKVACARCGHHMDVSTLPIFTQFDCPECHARQMVPGKLGAFLLLELLGSGGMGSVYRGLDIALSREVAIKVMHASLGADAQFVQNFLREARAAAAVNHRNVVQIFSFGQEKGQPYLVMELVNGGRLDSLIASGQPLEEAQALSIAMDLANGLRAAYDKGLMHGDIKPANILLDRNGAAKLVDFGLASFIRLQKGGSQEIWGTPFYLAPEKARRQKADHRADIYSLGATLFHALAVHPPFDGENATQVVLARLQAPPPDISTSRPDLHPETVRIITRMLEVDPFRRYPNYASLIADLEEAQRALRAGPAVRAAPAKTADQQAKAKKKWPLWLGAGLAGAALLALLALKLLPGPATGPGGKPTGGVAVTATNNPFSALEAQGVVAAVSPITLGDIPLVLERLDAQCRKAATNRQQTAWLRLYQAIALRAANERMPEATQLLKTLDQPTTAPLPRLLAAFLLNPDKPKALTDEMARQPDWFAGLAHFALGMELLRKAQIDPAAKHFAEYKPASPQAPAWPFAYQPLANHWLIQCQNTQRLLATVQRLMGQKKFKEARAELETARSKTSPYLAPLLQQQLDKVNAEEQKDLEEKKRRENAAQQNRTEPEPPQNQQAPVLATGRRENYTVVLFTNVGSSAWTVPAGVTNVEVLVVGGGGGGAKWSSGGGGGGMYYATHYPVTPGSRIPIVVGAGGVAGDDGNNGGDGGKSQFGSQLMAYGGLHGGRYDGGPEPPGNPAYGSDQGGYSLDGGATTNAGNLSVHHPEMHGRWSSGAGAGGPGTAKSGNDAPGGAGRVCEITGDKVYYAAGGGANQRGRGGSGIGGNGQSAESASDATAGAPHTGSGGGGGGGGSNMSNGGGSGVVIVAYRNPTAESTGEDNSAAQEEIAAVRELSTTLASLLRQYRFDAVSARVAGKAAKLKTAGGRAAGEQLLAVCRQLEALHTLIQRRLTAARPQPFADRELGGSGTVQSADAEGLQIAIGSVGSATKSWKIISPQVYLRMAEYSLAERPAGNEYGRYVLALAFYCQETGDARRAQRLVAHAVQADATLQETAQLLFPGYATTPAPK